MLKARVFRQKEKSVQCVPCCIAMLLDYYGKPHPLKTIIRELPLYREGTYAPQVGIYLMKHGFDVTMINFNPRNFVNKDRKMSTKKMIERFLELKRKEKKQRRMRGYFIRFLKEGGTLKLKIPGLKDIQKEIKAGRPVIVSMTTNFIYGKEPRHNSHTNLITGIDSNYVYVNDPAYGQRGGKKKYTHEDFLFGLYARGGNGSLVLAKPRKTKQAL